MVNHGEQGRRLSSLAFWAKQKWRRAGKPDLQAVLPSPPECRLC